MPSPILPQVPAGALLGQERRRATPAGRAIADAQPVPINLIDAEQGRVDQFRDIALAEADVDGLRRSRRVGGICAPTDDFTAPPNLTPALDKDEGYIGQALRGCGDVLLPRPQR